MSAENEHSQKPQRRTSNVQALRAELGQIELEHLNVLRFLIEEVHPSLPPIDQSRVVDVVASSLEKQAVRIDHRIDSLEARLMALEARRSR